MVHYLVEFRFHGYARKYLKKQIFDVSRKFKVKEVTSKRVVPHVTLVGPLRLRRFIWPFSLFINSSEKKLINEITESCKQFQYVKFSIDGFGAFDDTGVIYANIIPSNKMKELQSDLVDRLKPFCKLQKYDTPGLFKPHATIAFKDARGKMKKIGSYLNSNKPTKIDQLLLRVTVIKGKLILFEYDLILQRKLSRIEAKSKEIYRKTIEKLRSID